VLPETLRAQPRRISPAGSQNAKFCRVDSSIKSDAKLVDEYATEFTLPQRTSRRPFSLCQLIQFLDSIRRIGTGDPSWDQFGFVLSFNQCNLEYGAELEDLQGFTQVHSDQYPELASHYAGKIADWYAAQGQTDRTNQT
jgi:hypothetical protein